MSLTPVRPFTCFWLAGLVEPLNRWQPFVSVRQCQQYALIIVQQVTSRTRGLSVVAISAPERQQAAGAHSAPVSASVWSPAALS